MAREVKIAPMGYRRRFVTDSPAPRVQLRAHTAERRELDDVDGSDADNLDPARGVLTGLLFCAGMWAAIALLIWLIAR